MRDSASNHRIATGGRVEFPAPGQRWLLLGLVVLLGVGISVALHQLLVAHEEQLIRTQFASDAGKRVEAIQRVMLMRLSTVDALAAFFNGSDFVERDEFHTFTEPLVGSNKGVQALGWAVVVPDENRQAHEERVRKAEVAEYRIFERNQHGEPVAAKKRERYAPLLYAGPWAKNTALLGFDLMSIEKCRQAMAEAVASGEQVATVLPWFGENTAKQVLCVFKAAKNGTAPAGKTLPSRSATNGFVLGIFEVDAILDAALDFFIPVGIDVYLVPDTTTAADGQIFKRLSPLRSDDKASLHNGEPLDAVSEDLRSVTHFQVAGSRWTVECLPMAYYSQSRRTWLPLSVFVAGLLSTGLLSAYLYLLIGRAKRVQQLVAERTDELQQSEQRFRRLVDNAGDAFFLHDVDGNIIDVSKRACDVLGYTREELLSMHVSDIDLKFAGELDPPRYWNREPDKYPLSFEGVHRRKDGSIFPVELRLAPIDASGQRLMLALARDITDRKRAEQQLQAEQRLLREMLDLQERDRKLVAYEIHDGLAQQLAGALYKFQSIDQYRARDPEEARTTFDDAMRLLRDGMVEARRLISGLRPPVLDEAGIEAAVDYLIAEQRQRGGPEVEFDCEENLGRWAPPLEGAVFRIIQECLTNACRHSQSRKVRVAVQTSHREVLVDVQDWGVGFDPERVADGHFGLKGIRERARLMGGWATIETAPQEGTRIRVRLPLVRSDGLSASDQEE